MLFAQPLQFGDVCLGVVDARTHMHEVVVEVRHGTMKRTDELAGRIRSLVRRHLVEGSSGDVGDRAPDLLIVFDPGFVVRRANQPRCLEPVVCEVPRHGVEVEVDLGPKDRMQTLEHRDRFVVLEHEVRVVDQTARRCSCT